MKVSTLFALAGLLASASALPQETTATLSPAAKCAIGCGSSICCKAKCYSVPCPSEEMAKKTTQCAMNCPQGSGTPDDIVVYADCQTKCINANFFDGTTVIPNPTKTGAVSPTGTDSEDAKATGTGSPTGDSTPSPSVGAAAINAQLGSSAAGIVGILMAALAL
ncbi:hypothetical protein ACJ73_06160 [Blastomyces percursus]|uniref:Extracellular membrane protein CFEM domain-containing protein n=1 Tax=Blastomyces percursus TaxID=1658174 RepID=A0A1J9Q1L2_9EURO|nr:hypothetical protein ACJ73_06160 [Blastomyces percursus]